MWGKLHVVKANRSTRQQKGAVDQVPARSFKEALVLLSLNTASISKPCFIRKAKRAILLTKKSREQDAVVIRAAGCCPFPLKHF